MTTSRPIKKRKKKKEKNRSDVESDGIKLENRWVSKEQHNIGGIITCLLPAFHFVGL